MTGQLDLLGRTVGGTGDQHQRHFTPYLVALQILERLDEQLPGTPEVFVEPSCGNANFLRAARKIWPGALTIGCDIDPAAEGLDLCDSPILGDWPTKGARVARRWLREADPDLVVVAGNPPFKAEEDDESDEVLKHIKAAVTLDDIAPTWASLILPLALLGGSPKWAPVMQGSAAPVEAWPFTPRAWKVVRETPAYLWRERRVDDLPGTRVVPFAKRWKR